MFSKIKLNGINVRIASDSIYVWAENDDRLIKFDDLQRIICSLIVHGFKNGLPLRGVVTYGELFANNTKSNADFSLENNSLYGKALVEAYKTEEKMDWCDLLNSMDSYRERLDLNGDYARIWFVLWNNPPTRETVREILREAAQNWLYAAERGGVGNVPATPLGAREEADLCVRRGLLFPPDPYVLPEERELFLKLATRGGGEIICPIRH